MNTGIVKNTHSKQLTLALLTAEKGDTVTITIKGCTFTTTLDKLEVARDVYTLNERICLVGIMND